MVIIAYDLGTGGVKATLYDDSLKVLAKSFMEYRTYFPGAGLHEQKPSDWWNGVVESTKQLLAASHTDPQAVGAVAISGQSLTAIPVDGSGAALLERVPIWSDGRAKDEARRFFDTVDEERWYMTTGNGFPAHCYTIFKLMWMKAHQSEVFSNMKHVLGSKDYINYRMTGKILTDHSYASGTGGYNLKEARYQQEFWDAAGIDMDLLPKIVPSDTVVGYLTEQAASELGLTTKTAVMAGGVDNACMALGATGIRDGAAYISLGSSSWVPVTACRPVLDFKTRPYVFAHIEPGMYTSAYSIFAGGSSLRWVRDNLFAEFGPQAYGEIDRLAQSAPVGANGILFNPSLAGGTSQDKSVNIQGAFVGLSLLNNRADLARSVLEGIALNLKQSITYLQRKVQMEDEILICGGGSKSAVWLQMFADILDVRVLKTNIDQDAASLGAAAIAAKGMKRIGSYQVIDGIHRREACYSPDRAVSEQYKAVAKRFNYLAEVLSEFGDYCGV